MAAKRQGFETIRVEGALFTHDTLLRLASGLLDGMRPADYHLPEGKTLDEAIAESWLALRKEWAGFAKARARLAADAASLQTTNDAWLTPVLGQLGYGRLPVSPSPVIEDRVYPIERFYGHVPIHLVGCTVALDRSTRKTRGAARAPFTMVQEFLNRSDDHLWAFLANGLVVRLMRDNNALSRPAYVEFDLEVMLEGEVWPEFRIFWLLCHQSRVEARRREDCWLEKWRTVGYAAGTRMLDDLRKGVERSIEALGRGFLSHPKNDHLRDRLRTGAIDEQDYYRQLLRIVYRLLFLFVAEDRELLHPADAPAEACDLYDRHYSTSRLRRLAYDLRGSKHGDLWHGLSLVFAALGRSEGCPQLGLVGLGSFLWNPERIPDLNGPHEAAADRVPIHIANDDLLAVVRALAYFEHEKVLRRVDYRNLGSEELGGVYESLLELRPDIQIDAQQFSLASVAGNERKRSGSYYTPDALVQVLLDSSLDPVVEDRIRGKAAAEAEEAILGVTVCDPACGSGHFLIAAAHRLARHLARVRSGDQQPGADDYQHALRDVIGRCIYGVDLNPMAVELCKVSLWMEAIEPGKPLSFLDHHIQAGNSLLGTTPRLLKGGIPSEAFKAIEGDDPTVAAGLRADNERERAHVRSGYSFLGAPYIKLGNLPAEFARLSVAADSVSDVRAAETAYARLVSSAEYVNARLLADLWCAAFVWRKDATERGKLCPSEQMFRQAEANPHSLLPEVREEVGRLRDHYRFFHWHLAFPEIFTLPGGEAAPDNEHAGWNGGFACVLGNPPWDTLSPDAKEFFSQYEPEIRSQDKAGQEQTIARLVEEPRIAAAWAENRRDIYASVLFIKGSGRYRLFAPGNLGKGDFNVFRMFVELALDHTCPGGFASQIVPDGLYGGANSMALRKELFERFTLTRLWAFENLRGIWFEGIHPSTKFCLYAARKAGNTESFRAAFRIKSHEDLSVAKAGNELTIPVAVVREFSPLALAVAEASSQYEIDVARKMYGRWPKFADAAAPGPLRVYMCELHMGNDRDRFSDGRVGFPLYEGRMVAQYDHRAKGYRSGRGRTAVWADLSFDDPTKSIQPQWRIRDEDVPEKTVSRMQRFRVGFCDVTSPTNERSLIAALVPPETLAGHKVPTILFEPDSGQAMCVWLAVANSYVMDSLIRAKVGLTMSYTILDSQPFPRLADDSSQAQAIVPRVLRLTCTGPEMVQFWNEMASAGWCDPWSREDSVPGTLDEEERLRLRAELDVIVARDLYGLSIDEMNFILEGFPTAKKYEVETYGEFRSWRLINELFPTLPGEPHPGLPPSSSTQIDLLAAADEPDEASAVLDEA